METQQTETIVEKAVAYVKDALGMLPADKAPDVAAKPEYTDALEPATEEDMRLDPHAYAFNKIVERSRRLTDTERPNSAIDEHEQAAEELVRAEGSAQPALRDIQDISRGIQDGKTSGNNKDLSPAERHADESRPYRER